MHSPTWKLHKINADKLFIAQKFIEIALKYTKMTKSKKTSKTRQKFDFPMKLKITIIYILLPKCFLITAMHSVCCCSLQV